MSADLGNQLLQSQQITLTHKMIDELKVLQMSNIDLMQYIEEMLVENPLLEVDKPEELVDTLMSNIDEPMENDDGGHMEGYNTQKDFAEYTPAPISLRQHLLSQLGELKIDRKHKKITEYIINTIGDDGFLCESINSIAAALGVSLKAAKEALKTVRCLEPAGVGARNLKESIILQLKRKKLLNDTAYSIVKNYLELLGERKYKEIAKKMDISPDQVIKVHEIIRSLTPKPGLQFLSSGISYIIPELIVKEINNKYVVMFYDEKMPALRINEAYRSLMKLGDCGKEGYKYIKSKISKAVEIINAIEQRKRTILATADFIVQHQESFFRKGYQYLKPLTMKQVADEIGIHESTVSRTVNCKYIQTPRGIFELKYFFSARLEAEEGSDISANSVKDAIKKIILREDKSKPLSDEQIRKALEDRGMKVARRTVAKYRETLSIPPASMRK